MLMNGGGVHQQQPAQQGVRRWPPENAHTALRLLLETRWVAKLFPEEEEDEDDKEGFNDEDEGKRTTTSSISGSEGDSDDDDAKKLKKKTNKDEKKKTRFEDWNRDTEGLKSIYSTRRESARCGRVWCTAARERRSWKASTGERRKRWGTQRRFTLEREEEEERRFRRRRRF
jgi:hypothetical protein